MAIPATGAFIGTPASISDRLAPHTDRHRAGTVRLGDLRNHADHVRESSHVRQHGGNAALGQPAVADLAALRRTDHAGFADAVGREVVVQHEVLAVLALESVDDLLVLPGAERGHDQRLGLAAGEQRRAVRARQQPDAYGDRPHGARITPVDARLSRQDALRRTRSSSRSPTDLADRGRLPAVGQPGRRRFWTPCGSPTVVSRRCLFVVDLVGGGNVGGG